MFYDIITIGSATRDVYLKSKAFKIIESEKFETLVGECLALGSKNEVSEIFFDTGGGGTNTAVTFSNLGLKTASLVRVGDDESGREVLRVLRGAKVDTRLIQIDDKNFTSYSTLLLAGTGERTVLVYRGSSNQLSWDKIVKGLSRHRTKWLYITSLGGNISLLKNLIDFANQKNIKVGVNPGGRELRAGLGKLKSIFARVDILNVNREEAAEMVGENFKNLQKILKKMKGLSRGIEVITDGPQGAYAIYKNKLYFAPSLGTKPLNTTGAGDAFGSAFATGIILRNDIDYALRLGTLNADGVIQKMGAKKGLLKGLPSARGLRKVRVSEIIR